MQQSEVQSALGKNLQKINTDYQNNIQIAKFTDLSLLEQKRVLVYAGLDKQDSHVFFFDGNSSYDFESAKVMYLYISQLDQKIENKQNYIDKETLYDCIYRFRRSWIIRVFTIPQTIKESSYEVLPITEITLHLPCQFIDENYALVQVVKESQAVVEKDELCWRVQFNVISMTNIFETNQFPPQWRTLLNIKIASKLPIQLTQFQENTGNIYGIPFDRLELNKFGLPIILDHLLNYFTQQPERFASVDIFRKCGSKENENELFELLESGKFECLQMVDDVNLVCSLTKKLFSMVPQPLIGFQQYNRIILQIANLKPGSEHVFIESIFDELSKLNRMILQIMISFILQITQQSEINHMTPNNMAIVFAPCFLRPPQVDQSSIANIGLSIKFLFMLITNFDAMFPNFSFKIFLTPITNIMSSTASSSSSSNNSNHEQQLHSSGEMMMQQKL